MDQSSISSLIILLLLLALNVLITLSYHALVNAQQSVLSEWVDKKKRGALLALDLSEDATTLMNTHQLSVVLVRFFSAAIAAIGLAPALATWFESFGMQETPALLLAEAIVLLSGAVIMLVIGGQVPAAVGASYANELAQRFARFFWVLEWILAPVARLLRFISETIIRILGIKTMVHNITEEEIMTLVDAGQEEGVIETEEKEMIYSIFQLDDTVAREVMVPRLDLVALPIDTPLDDVVQTVLEAGHSRIPIYDDNIDHIAGLLYAKDLLRLWREGGNGGALSGLLRDAYYVPEGKSAMHLLREMQQKRVHLAIVVDEYGGTAGLVTLEDLIEEIIGEVRDEYDHNELAAYQQVNENEYICNARLDLDDLNRLLDINLPTDESDTLGGFIFAQVGEVPEPGAIINTRETRLVVLTVNQRRIGQVRVTKIEPIEEEDTEQDSLTPEA